MMLMLQTMVRLILSIAAIYVVLGDISSTKERDASCPEKVDTSGEQRTVSQEQVHRYGESFGVKQKLARVEDLLETATYIKHVVKTDPALFSVHNTCKNEHAYCTHWASLGMCHAEGGKLKISCAPACRTCHRLVDFKTRCKVNPEGKALSKRGDLNKLFERIVDPALQEFQKLGPVVLSRPSTQQGTVTVSNNDGPWVVSLENFATAEECDRLIELGYGGQGYQRSSTGRSKSDLVRTSQSSVCYWECKDDPVVKDISERMSNMTGFPMKNFEYLQLVKYEKGQFYKAHYDTSNRQADEPCGTRVLTFFLYLNDVEKGGQTSFERINGGLDITPTKGKAVLWTNVLDGNPLQFDSRTIHEARPVEGGQKFAVNAWIHLHEYRGLVEKECCF